MPGRAVVSGWSVVSGRSASAGAVRERAPRRLAVPADSGGHVGHPKDVVTRYGARSWRFMNSQ